MMNTFRTISGAAFAVAMFILSCCAMDAKKPVFKNSVWENKQEIFVADAGTMTLTTTLTFGAKNDVQVRWTSYLPAHPAMYRNRDGSVDRIPASSSESIHEGSWQFKKGVLSIKQDDGAEQVYQYLDGTLVGGESFDGKKPVFTRKP